MMKVPDLAKLDFNSPRRGRGRLAWTALWMSLGVLGNLWNYDLFFGVNFIFGSIATLLALAQLGTRCGLLATLIAASSTFWIWNHPYAALVLLGEGIFVARKWGRFRRSLLLTSGFYWAVFGIPAVWCLYHFFLGMDPTAASLAAVKQATNGILNALIASLIWTYVPLFHSFVGKENRRISVFQNIFNIFVGLALIPSLIVVMLDAQSVVKQIEDKIHHRLATITTGIVITAERWRTQHLNAIVTVAKLASEFSEKDRNRLQSSISLNRQVWPDFYGTFVTDSSGSTIAFDPLLNAKGESTLGLSFSDRAYFQVLKAGAPGPHISDVFMARGGVFEPVLNVSHPVTRNGRFAGIASGSLNLRQLSEILANVPGESGYEATLIDQTGRTISSNRPDFKPLVDFETSRTGTIEKREQGHFQHFFEGSQNLPPMAKWAKSSLGRSVEIPGPGGWRLVVEIPLAPMQEELYQRYLRDLGFLLGLSLIILFGSYGVASWISTPLTRLSFETTNLPNRLESNQPIHWPKSTTTEIHLLVANFQSTFEALQQKFRALQSSQEQLKTAKEQAETANQLKSAFLANMSHEIRTPLGVILGFAELLNDSNLPESERRQFIETILRNGEQLSLLINDILDLSKVEAGFLTLELVPLSLGSMIAEVISDFKMKAQQKNLDLSSDLITSTGDQIVSDPVRLKQILSNLVGNAIKFTRQGSVHVFAQIEKEFVSIEVIDTGIGIPLEHQEKLFRPFSQADESTTRNFGGTGLGLALSKRISHLLGGHLELKKSEPGVGSVFSLRLKRWPKKSPGVPAFERLAKSPSESH